MKFYVVRHGEKAFIPYDPPLTEKGRIQAEKTGMLLKNVPIKKIIVSPKKRTQETAHIINSFLNVPVFTDDRIQERLEWEMNETFEEFINEWDKTDLDRTYTPTHGNSSKNHGEKAISLLNEQNFLNTNILVVTHGGTIGDILRELFSDQDLPHINSPSGAPFMQIHECSVTIFERNEKGYTLITVADTSHL